jgi:release factor glutamine methyltransferase
MRVLVRVARVGEVVSRLRRAGCVAAEDEAEELLVSAPDDATLEAWIRRREGGEPLVWITGTTTFCGQPLRVDTGVYVPRAQTEELAHRAAAALAERGGWAADLCTGAGPVAAHLMAAVPGAHVVGTDIDRRAAGCARRNGVPVVLGNLGDPLRSRAFEVVTAVVPYVPTGALRFLPSDVVRHEPRLALDGGRDGLDLARRIVMAAARLLYPRGWLFLELGGDQPERLAPTLAALGFGPATVWFDDDGDARGIAAQRLLDHDWTPS